MIIMSSESISDHVLSFNFVLLFGFASSQIYYRDRSLSMILQSWWLEVHGGTTKGGSTCFRVLLSKGVASSQAVATKQVEYRGIGLEILSLKMLLIEMHDLSARQLELQLDDDRPSHVFGFAMIKPMFMDEINLYTSLISVKGLPFICNQCFMLGQIHQIRWKSLVSSLSIHGLINFGGIL